MEWYGKRKTCGGVKRKQESNAAGLNGYGGVPVGLLGGEAVGALAVITLGGIDTQAHVLFQRAAQEAAHRVSLPVGGLLQLLE